MKNGNVTKTHSILLSMLRFALIEIRSSENSNLSQCLADIFHNVPLLLTMEFDEEKSNQAFKHIFSKAEKHKMLKYIKSLEEAALKSVEDKQVQIETK